MILYYDLEKDLWFQTANRPYTFGFTEKKVLYQEKVSPSSIPFPLHLRNGRNLGPLIGIMAGQKDDYHIVGNGPLFKELQMELLDQGGLSIVFTPEGIRQDGVRGFIYIPDQDRWQRITAPLPHLVYNRVPFRKMEQATCYQKAFSFLKEKGIPFFNPAFINKFEFYKIMQEEKEIKQYLPETILVEKKETLHSFLKYWKSIYIKPVHASQGRGIFKLILKDDGTIVLMDMKKHRTFENYEQLWTNIRTAISRKSCIAQKGITPLVKDGQRFDFRILAHFNGKSYEVTGIGVRQSPKNSLTTHLPNGGKLAPFDEVKSARHQAFIEEIVQRLGNLLSNKMGFFGEFSLDAGVTEKGDYVIYEVNSKPMVFDEPEIERRRIVNLVHLFQDFFYTHNYGSEHEL